MTNRIKNGRVPTPTSRALRLWRLRFLPIVVWCGAVAVVASLLSGQIETFDAVGVMELREVQVAPLVDGTVQSLNVDLFDEVRAGQVIGMLDDTLVRSALVTAQAELTHLKAQFRAARAKLQITELRDERRFSLNEQEARLDLLDRIAQQEARKGELVRVQMQLVYHKQLIEKGIGERSLYDDIRLQIEALDMEMKENEVAIEAARFLAEESAQRWAERQEVVQDVELSEVLDPLRQAVNVQEARILELTEARKLLMLRAPLSGKITDIDARVGQSVEAGTPVVAISAVESNRVVAYVSERSVENLELGAKVLVCSRRQPRQVVEARVLKMGAKVETLPNRLRRNPLVPEWGLAILVGEVPPRAFFPGETLDLRFLAPIQ